MKSHLPLLAGVAVAVGFVNFIVLVALWGYVGGSALGGYHSDGHFFVTRYGILSEVGATTWYLMLAQEISTFLTHPLALAGMAYSLFKMGIIRLPRT